jgi:zinc protease
MNLRAARPGYALPLAALLGLGLWLALAAASASAGVLEPGTVRSAVLNNGLRVIVCEREATSVVSAEVVIRAGSADDYPEAPGIAHLLEHLCWTGGPGQNPRGPIEDVGGITNAGTLRDYTRFYATVPAGNLPLALTALSQMVLPSSFEEGAIRREAAAIFQESAERGDLPRAILNDLAFEELYGTGHPYSQRIEGDETAISSITRGQVEALHRAWYVPNNMAVVIVGNVALDDALAAVEALFGGLLPRPLPPRSREVPPRPSPGAELIVRTPFRQAYVMAAFVGPAGDEYTQVCASDLLITLLSHGNTGRLVTALRDTRQLASAVGVDFLTQRDRALFGVWAVCDAERVPEVKRVIRSELARLAAEPVPPSEFSAAKRLLAAGYSFANEIPSDQAATLGFYEAIDSYRAATYYSPRVRSLRPADVSRVASWYSAEPVWIVLTPESAER